MLQGNRLKELRKENDLTQKELGEKVNVTKVSISCYESGKRTPNIDTLTDLANILNVDVDYLLGREANIVAEDPEPYIKRVSKEEITFLSILQRNKKIRTKIMENPERFAEYIIKSSK